MDQRRFASSIRKLVRGSDSFASVEGTSTRGKRDRDFGSVQILSERRNLHAHLERKLNWLFRKRRAGQTRSTEAEAEMDVRNWEQRNADCALYEANRDLESQRSGLYQATQRARGWGPQGRPATAGGGPARVPNLRVCCHFFFESVGTRRGGRARLHVFPWYRPVRRTEVRSGCPQG